MVRFLATVVISFGLFCCEVQHDSLTLAREHFHGNQLKLNGYYYDEGMGDSAFWDLFVLYQNGIILNCGTSPPLALERRLNDTQFINKLKNNRTCWGVYQVSGDSIRFEKWYHGGGAPKQVFVRKGVILNDTTFLITESSRPNGRNRSRKHEVYRFRKFSPKPDSTNQFIP
jgi:hypothetical protein